MAAQDPLSVLGENDINPGEDATGHPPSMDKSIPGTELAREGGQDFSSPFFVTRQLGVPSPVELDEDFGRLNANNSFERLARAEMLTDVPGGVVLKRRNCARGEEVLSTEMAQQLRRALPTRYRAAVAWSLVYSSAQYGFSLNTLYSRSRALGGHACMLAIKDDQNQIFGAFASEAWRTSIGHFGSGQCFLWKWQGNTARIFGTTGRNNYYLIGEPTFIAVGCGESKFGLWLDAELMNGSSNPVSTFDNESLSRQPEFICIGIELWTFDVAE